MYCTQLSYGGGERRRFPSLWTSLAFASEKQLCVNESGDGRQTRRSICSTAINCLAHYGRPVAGRHVKRATPHEFDLQSTDNCTTSAMRLLAARSYRRAINGDARAHHADSTALQPVNAKNSQKPRKIILEIPKHPTPVPLTFHCGKSF